MKCIIICTLVAISTTSAHAATYNYICKDHGKSFPLKVDDTQNTLEWKGTTYKIKQNEDCAKFGWRAEKDGTSFDFCTATKGYAGIEQNGIEIACDLKREAASRTEEQLEKAKEAAKNSDFATAFRIWEPLARQGNAQAQYEIGIMYYHGESVRRDFAKALMWRQKAARQGHTAAQVDIGVQYSNGDGVRLDHVEATKWFRQAAEAGQVLGQFNLGLNYELGQGVTQDIGEALKWYVRAAEQNDEKAQWHAARIYGNDAFSRYDPDKAIHWYGRAALNGIAPAQLALGILYSRGRGVPVDMVRARMWLKLATGDMGSAVSFDNGPTGDEAKKLVPDIERFMDQRQLDASKAMIAQCQEEKDIQKALVACGLR